MSEKPAFRPKESPYSRKKKRYEAYLAQLPRLSDTTCAQEGCENKTPRTAHRLREVSTLCVLEYLMNNRTTNRDYIFKIVPFLASRYAIFYDGSEWVGTGNPRLTPVLIFGNMIRAKVRKIFRYSFPKAEVWGRARDLCQEITSALLREGCTYCDAHMREKIQSMARKVNER